jgi:hypothetical protein
MTIAIIVGVLLLAIAPLMWVLPSRRERDLAALREAARKLGFTLQVTEVDHPSPTAEEQVSASGRMRRPMLPCVAYRLPRAAGATPGSPVPPAVEDRVRARAARDDADDTGAWAEAAAEEVVQVAPRTRVTRRMGARSAGLPDDWRLDDGFDAPDAELCALLPSLGPDVLAVESTGSTVAVFWTERGGEARLQALAGTLRDLMRAQPPR